MGEQIENAGNSTQSFVSPHKDITTLARGTSVALIGRVTGRGLHALGQVILARMLGPEAFGLYAIGWTILRITGLIAPLGLHNGVIRFGSHYWRKDPLGLKGVLFQSLGFVLFSSLLMSSALFLLAPWLAEEVFQKPDLTVILRWFALGLPLMAGLKVASAATRITQRMKFAVYAEDLSQPAVNLVLVLFFYLLGWRLLGAVAAIVISFGIAIVLALYYVKHLFSKTFSARLKSGPSIRKLLTFSLQASFAGIFILLTFWSARLFIGYFRPAAEVGIYQAIDQVPFLFTMILNAFNAIFSPMIADLYHRREFERLEELFRVSTKWGFYLSLPMFLVVCFAPQEMIIVVFGSEYVSGALPLVILVIAQLINVGTGAVGFLLIMTGRQNHWLVFSSVILFLHIILSLLLIPRWGMTGAALATACSISGLFLGGLFQVKRLLGLWPYDYRYLKVLLSTVLTVAALFLLRFTAGVSPVFNLLLTTTVSGIVFGGTLILLGLDGEDKEFIRLIRGHIGVG